MGGSVGKIGEGIGDVYAPVTALPMKAMDMVSGGGPKPTGLSSSSKEKQFQAMLQGIRQQAPLDEAKIMAEVNKQKELGTGYAGDYANTRKQALSDLSNLLVEQQNRQLGLEVPDLAEQANLKGIFRSTGLGNSIAREAGNLAASTSEKLAEQGLADRSANIGDIQNVNNAYLQGRYSPLQRSLSLEDLATNAQIAKTTGQALQPQEYTPGKTAGQTAIPAAAIQAGAKIAAK